MGTVTPYIYKFKLPRVLRWPLKFSDIEACVAPRPQLDVELQLFFTTSTMGYPPNIGSDPPPSETAQEVLYLVTVSHNPNSMAAYHLDPDYIPRAGRALVQCHVWAVPRASAVAQQVHREHVRAALLAEVLALVSAGTFTKRWLIRIRAMAEPLQLECLRTTWTGFYPDGTHQRCLPLPVQA